LEGVVTWGLQHASTTAERLGGGGGRVVGGEEGKSLPGRGTKPPGYSTCPEV
jgi:hypothetical protein